MKKTIIKVTRLICCVLALGFASVSASSYAGHGPQLMQPITTKDQVSAIKLGSKVTMTCAKCKTVQIAEVDQKHGILGWFQPKTKHLCPGCGGYIVPTLRSVKGIESPQFVHTCSKCGSKSAFCCGSQTKSM
jgi:RNase P subunit RPR2